MQTLGMWTPSLVLLGGMWDLVVQFLKVSAVLPNLSNSLHTALLVHWITLWPFGDFLTVKMKDIQTFQRKLWKKEATPTAKPSVSSLFLKILWVLVSVYPGNPGFLCPVMSSDSGLPMDGMREPAESRTCPVAKVEAPLSNDIPWRPGWLQVPCLMICCLVSAQLKSRLGKLVPRGCSPFIVLLFFCLNGRSSSLMISWSLSIISCLLHARMSSNASWVLQLKMAAVPKWRHSRVLQ